MQPKSAHTPAQTKAAPKISFPARAIAPLIIKVALVNGLVVVGSILLGRFLDTAFHTRVTFFVILAVVSLQLALYITYKLGMSTATRLEQADATDKTDVGATNVTNVTNVTAKESDSARP